MVDVRNVEDLRALHRDEQSDCLASARNPVCCDLRELATVNVLDPDSHASHMTSQASYCQLLLWKVLRVQRL